MSEQPVHIDNAGKIYRRLLRYALPHWGRFLIGVVGMVIFAATDASLAYFVQRFLGGAFVEPDPRILWAIPLGALLIFLVRGVGDYLAQYYPGWVGRQVIKSLRAELFAHYLRLPMRYYDAVTSGGMLSRLTYNIELVAEATTQAVTVLIRDTLTVIFLLGMLVWLDWKLSLFVLALAPVIAKMIQIVNRVFRRYSARIQASMGDVTRTSKEALDGIKVIKIFGAERYEEDLFGSANERNRHGHVRLIRSKALAAPILQMVAALSLAAVLYFSIDQVLKGALRIDEFMAFLTALLLITAPMRRLVGIFGPLQQGIAAGASVFEILDTPVEDAGGSRELTRARGEIEFRKVVFSYTDDKGEVLSDINLRIEPGQTVAIVGRSGSGKSTLVGMLARFYDPDAGAVLLDGEDLREYRLQDLRRQISLVSQDVMLFDDSIRRNIAFGITDPEDPRVAAAAQSAYVMEFAAGMPEGLDTQIGERGALLSGGQRQRISIARALLKDSPVLVLDEATSALDNESERRIQQALATLSRDRTTIVIAHRLSTIENADLIVVMDEGHIVESGRHAELLAREGLYAQLHRRQFAE